MISFKQSSSLDENSYICKGKEYGKSAESIYYSGKGNEVRLTNFNAYYVSVYENVKLDIAGDNNISLLHLNDTKIEVTGTGSLKFKEGSFVKKVVAGEAVYQFVYNKKSIINEEDKIYEGTVVDFEENYSTLSLKNKLPEVFNIEDYTLVQTIDFTNMTSVVVTDSWLDKHIDTKLNKTVLDGYGIIEYVKPKEEKTTEETKDEDKTLKSDKVIFVSDKKVDKKYKLNVDDLQKTEVAEGVSNQLNDLSLISFYDVNVYNGKKQVAMKNGKYTIKIKIDENNIDEYENYQIIYVNDDGEIEEYLDGIIEDGYIVFKTSHLSQYGVIAKEKVVPEVTLDVKSSNIHANVLKISLLAFIVIAYLVILSVLLIKGKIIKFKKRTIVK